MKRNFWLGLTIVMFLGSTWHTFASQQQDSQQIPKYGAVLFAENLMIPMRDGVKMATDIYRPTINGMPAPGQFPLLLQRTPYNKSGRRLQADAEFFASHGYIVAVQDERGAYKSEGVQTKYVGMGKDGYDTIEWLAKLPYIDGQIGMWGTSYAAHTQTSSAILNPPHLKMIMPSFGGLYNAWLDKIRNHGAFELAQQLGWAFNELGADPNNPVAQNAIRHEKAVDWIGAMHGKQGLTPLAQVPSFDDYIFKMMTDSDYDDYWKQSDLNWSLYLKQTSDIPMLLLSGWYDSYAFGTVQTYIDLLKIKKSPLKLLIGPWTHAGATRSYSGNVEFGPEAAIGDFNTDFHLRWFDYFLKNKSDSPIQTSPVRVFVMGTGDGHKDANGRLFHGGYWKNESTWPITEAHPTSYYFHPDGSLSSKQPAANAASTTYTYDPNHPVPTIGGNFSSTTGIVAPGGYDQREHEFTGDETKGFYGSRSPYLPLRARQDVVVYQTDPLPQNVEVIGPIQIKLYASSTATDTDFTAKLVDVYPPSKDYPDGYDLNITDGIIRARYRNPSGKQELIKPGTVYQLQIDAFPTANVFKKGHRIRVDISSSNFPRFDVNPNTGEPLGMNRRMMNADNSVYQDALHPSQVILPIVEAH